MHNMPLAHWMRPSSFDEFFGQNHLVGANKPLRVALEKGHLHSMLLYGPSGTGKTSLAHLIAKSCHAMVETLSAINSGVKELREVIEKAQILKHQRLIVFIDEIHRYNKAQQDVLLPYIEDGTFVVIGATTENPAFAMNDALLSRMQIYRLKALDEKALEQILQNAMAKMVYHQQREIDFAAGLQQRFIESVDGDARKLLNDFEFIINSQEGKVLIDEETIQSMVDGRLRRFDNHGQHFHQQISALHKSIRGSDSDAALYWLCRMLDGGCDPLYIGRRLVRIASEDIGLADPRALEITTHACMAYERLGSPEGELVLAQAVVYLAVAAKSDAVYLAFQKAMNHVKTHGSDEVPLNLHHPYYYRHPHDYPKGVIPGERYFPNNQQRISFYQPKQRGLEIKISQKWEWIKSILDSNKEK
ncbi:MAG: putative ATPase [Pseudomonadota bacterium]|nr:putative ATPase [Pseudomonadota bacterium]